ncbi:hypothetical protein [Streptomyces sp. CG 926]|uniref:hypothetical protein n=1 Tax=Streptomyces sp. CG 926 TaxID=1882405 RepID=UPI0011B57ED4|nr:hypothetical protein [Streptomyces sp. CG 926]
MGLPSPIASTVPHGRTTRRRAGARPTVARLAAPIGSLRLLRGGLLLGLGAFVQINVDVDGSTLRDMSPRI